MLHLFVFPYFARIVCSAAAGGRRFHLKCFGRSYFCCSRCCIALGLVCVQLTSSRVFQLFVFAAAAAQQIFSVAECERVALPHSEGSYPKAVHESPVDLRQAYQASCVRLSSREARTLSVDALGPTTVHGHHGPGHEQRRGVDDEHDRARGKHPCIISALKAFIVFRGGCQRSNGLPAG